MHIFNDSFAVPAAKDLRQAIRSTACGKVARWQGAPALGTTALTGRLPLRFSQAAFGAAP